MPDFQKAQTEAELLLAQLFFSAPPSPIMEIADSLGLIVRNIDFGNRQDISGVLDVQNQIIYINERDNAVRKRFTIAHEIGLWVLHRADLQTDPNIGIYYRKPIGEESEDTKKEADWFAANLLVPLKQLEELAPKCSDDELAKIFAVSLQVIGYRKLYSENLAHHG